MFGRTDYSAQLYGRKKRHTGRLLVALLVIAGLVFGVSRYAPGVGDYIIDNTVTRVLGGVTMRQAYGDALTRDRYVLQRPESDVDPAHQFTFRLDKGVAVDGKGVIKGSGVPIADAVKVYQNAALTVPVKTVTTVNTTGEGDKARSVIAVRGNIADTDAGTAGGTTTNGWYSSPSYYIVRYIDSKGNRLDKPVVRYFTAKDPDAGRRLDSPAVVNARLTRDGNVDISWGSVPGAESYEVYAYLVKNINAAQTGTFASSGAIVRLGETKGTRLDAAQYADVKAPAGSLGTATQNRLWSYVASATEDMIKSCKNGAADRLPGCDEYLAKYGEQWTDAAGGRMFIAVVPVRDGVHGWMRFHDQSSLASRIPVEETVADKLTKSTSNWWEGDGDVKDLLDTNAARYVVMADGHTEVRSVRFDKDKATQAADGWDVPYVIDGTAITGTIRIKAEGDTLDDALARLQDKIAKTDEKRKTGSRTDDDTATEDTTGKDDTGKTDSTDEKSPYFFYASSDYAAYIANNMLAGRTSIDISKWFYAPSSPEINDVINEVMYQNPYILAGSQRPSVSYAYNGKTATLRIKYPDGYADDQKALAKWAKDNAAKVGNGDVRDKVAKIDAILSEGRYDWDGYNDSTSGRDLEQVRASHPYTWSSGIALRKLGVCMSYSYAFTTLAHETGVDSRVVTGTGNGGGHAWNIVNVDGKWLLQDSTWDDDDQNNTVHDNYRLKDPNQIPDHQADKDWIDDSKANDYGFPTR